MIAGGNSGGTAGAVAAGIAKIGIGLDTFGSCRIPSSLCGVFGFRPTSGRYTLKGTFPISYTADDIGIITNNLDDIILVDSILTSGWDKRRRSSIDPGNFGALNNLDGSKQKIRLGVCKKYFGENLSNDVANALCKVLVKLDGDEHFDLVSVDMCGIDELMSTCLGIYHHELCKDFPKFLEEYNTDISFNELVKNLVSSDVKKKFASLLESHNEDENDEHYLAALEERSDLGEFYQDIFDNYQIAALIFVTTPIEAKPLAKVAESVEIDGKIMSTFDIYTQNTIPAAFAGTPSITLPLARTCTNLPVGITLEGEKGRDRFLFEIAAALKDAIDE